MKQAPKTAFPRSVAALACVAILAASGSMAQAQSTGTAAAAKPSDAPRMDERAITLLRRLQAEFLAGQNAMSFNWFVSYDDVIDGREKITFMRSGTNLLVRDKGFYSRAEGENGIREWRYDGQRATFVAPAENYYASTEFKQGFDALVDSAQKNLGSEIPLYAIMRRGLPDRLEEGLKGAAYLGITQIAGEEVHHLAFAEEAEDWQVWLWSTREKTVVFSIIDTGMGIPKEKQKLIFEAFQQVDGTISRKFGGTGLGLSISKELATLLGGTIYMESFEGKGSRFSLHLPEKRLLKQKISTPDLPAGYELNRQTNKLDECPPFQSEPANNKQETLEKIKDDRTEISPNDKSILIIEDDPKFLRILSDISHEQGFKCLVAEDGKTGLQLADYYKPSAIILDILLPDISGLTVMTRLKENFSTRHVPVHIVSATDNKLDARKMGAVNYLEKPVSKEELSQVFNQLNKIITKDVKELLIVEHDRSQANALIQCIGEEDVHITVASTAAEAYDHVLTGNFECMILDLQLPDTSGVALLRKIRTNEDICYLPIIVYTGKDITKEEKIIIDQYAESIIVKGVDSDRRLLDETTLFLHRVEANLPKEKQEVLRMLHDKEEILSNKKILVVDDDMRNVFSLKKVLESRGMQILIGKNGREALEYLDRNPDIDLILMDIMMPEMDGYEATRNIRKQPRFKDLPVIALTANAMKGDRLKCVEAGACDYLAKPIDMDRLFSMLRVWLY